MLNLIESLESRQFLSATTAVSADLSALKAETKAIVAQVKVLPAHVKSSNTSLIAAVHALNVSSNGRRLVSLKHDQTTVFNSLKKEAATLQKIVNKDGQIIVNDVRKLAAKPGNADLEAVLATDVTTIENDTTSNTTTLANEYSNGTNLIEADLNDIATANPGSASVQSLSSAQVTTLQGFVTTGGNQNTLVASDVGQLINDAG